MALFSKKDDKKYDIDLKGQKIPILILDERWHELFPESIKPSTIKRLEKELTDLIKRQGQLSTDINDMKKKKQDLMREIVGNMKVADNPNDTVSIKLQKKNGNLIEDINRQIEKNEIELLEIPNKIRLANEKLMIESMFLCYKKIENNKKDIEEIGAWIQEVRNSLKEKILEKQDKEIQNERIYTNMHDIIGAKAIEIFDAQYKGEL